MPPMSTQQPVQPPMEQSPMGGSADFPTGGNSVGATPGVQGVPTPMTPEHKAELAMLLTKVKQEYMKWKSMSFGVQNQANEVRRGHLRKVFQMLQASGVDLNDQASVSRYLAQIKQRAPQHFDAITRALDYLLGTNYENQQDQQQSQPDVNLPPENLP